MAGIFAEGQTCQNKVISGFGGFQVYGLGSAEDRAWGNLAVAGGPFLVGMKGPLSPKPKSGDVLGG